MTKTVKFEWTPGVGGSKSGCADRHLRAIRRHVIRGRPRGSPENSPVIKSNAYGHGSFRWRRALSRARADWFGVTLLHEGAPNCARAVSRAV